ncbi:MAG TPA: hypothetical protein VF020_07170 [Chthoniobacterales bacterium]
MNPAFDAESQRLSAFLDGLVERTNLSEYWRTRDELKLRIERFEADVKGMRLSNYRPSQAQERIFNDLCERAEKQLGALDAKARRIVREKCDGIDAEIRQWKETLPNSPVTYWRFSGDMGLLLHRSGVLWSYRALDGRIEKYVRDIEALRRTWEPITRVVEALTDFRSVDSQCPLSAPVDSPGLLKRLSDLIKEQSGFGHYIDWDQEASLEARSNESGSSEKLVFKCMNRAGEQSYFAFNPVPDLNLRGRPKWLILNPENRDYLTREDKLYRTLRVSLLESNVLWRVFRKIRGEYVPLRAIAATKAAGILERGTTKEGRHPGRSL